MVEDGSDTLVVRLQEELAAEDPEGASARAARIAERLRGLDDVLPKTGERGEGWPGSANVLARLAPTGALKRPGPRTSDVARRVLLVDDHEDTCDLFQELLSLDGHDVATAQSGVDALVLLAARPFDIAMLDIGLPDVDGSTIASAVKRVLGEGAPRLVAMTGFAGAAAKADAVRAGFDEHRAKPVAGKDLARAIAAAPRREI